MTITVYKPLLSDFIVVSMAMPEDERAQLEALTGEDFDIDGCAVGNFMVPGHKFVLKCGDRVLCVGGFAPERPGVWRDFMLNTPEAFSPENYVGVTRTCRRIMDAMFASKQAHRLECVVPASRLESRPKLVKWYKVLGYRREALLAGYCADGSDAVLFSRVGH